MQEGSGWKVSEADGPGCEVVNDRIVFSPLCLMPGTILVLMMVLYVSGYRENGVWEEGRKHIVVLFLYFYHVFNSG